MIFDLIYIKKPPLLLRGVNEVKRGRRVGTTPPPVADAMQRIPPNNGGDKRSKIGGGMWLSRRPRRLCCKKENPPIIGGLNEMKSGRCDGYHTAPSSIENPPCSWGE
jgi:hypothetical protein